MQVHGQFLNDSIVNYQDEISVNVPCCFRYCKMIDVSVSFDMCCPYLTFFSHISHFL